MTTQRHGGKLTDLSRDVLSRTMRKAQELGHTRVGTSHLLAGLLAAEGSLAAAILRDLGVTLEAAAMLLTKPEAESSRSGSEELTETVKQVLEQAQRGSQARGVLDTEQLLLAILEIGDGPGLYDTAASALTQAGVTSEGVQKEAERRSIGPPDYMYH